MNYRFTFIFVLFSSSFLLVRCGTTPKPKNEQQVERIKLGEAKGDATIREVKYEVIIEKPAEKIKEALPTDSEPKPKLLTGFNINWSFMPALHDDLLKAAALLKPHLIRFPGGTLSKKWDWEKGKKIGKSKAIPHKLSDLKKLKDATNSNVIFVLNTIHRSLENQIKLLKTAQGIGIPVKYIEMGNEHYLGKGKNKDDAGKHQDNVIAFPTGKEYAELVNKWSPSIRKEFPNALIGITMFGRTNGGTRGQSWNSLIVKNINKNSFDAYIYHIYVHFDHKTKLNTETIKKAIQTRVDTLKQAMIKDDSKKVWITEYGVHASTLERTVAVTSALADYTESIASISLPQVLFKRAPIPPQKSDSFFSLLTPPDGKALTKLGKMYAERVKSK